MNNDIATAKAQLATAIAAFEANPTDENCDRCNNLHDLVTMLEYQATVHIGSGEPDDLTYYSGQPQEVAA